MALIKSTLFARAVWIMACTVLISASLQGATYHVNNRQPNARDTNAGTENSPWQTIQRAATSLLPGDTVIVHDGTYNERVSPANSGTPNSLITYAAQSRNVILTPGFSILAKNYTRVIGFQITGGDGVASILVIDCIGVQIFDNWIHHTSNIAIRLLASTGSTCSGCIIRGNTIAYPNSGPQSDGKGSI